MTAIFYISAVVACVSTLMVVTRRSAAQAALYLILSLLSVALVFFVLGAPFAAALEVIVYAGAIMVLFVFVIMLLNLGRAAAAREAAWLKPRAWFGPVALALVLAAELAYVLFTGTGVRAGPVSGAAIEPREVALALFGPYVLGVELASFLLLAGLLGAYHLVRGGDQEGA